MIVKIMAGIKSFNSIHEIKIPTPDTRIIISQIYHSQSGLLYVAAKLVNHKDLERDLNKYVAHRIDQSTLLISEILAEIDMAYTRKKVSSA